jgi:aspartate aminotransferase
MFSKKAAGISPSVTLTIAAKAKELAKTQEVVNFSAGEPAFELFKEMKDAGIKAIEDNFTKYTPASGMIELKQAISKKFKEENNLDYGADQIVISNGGKHTLFNTFFCLCNPGDEIIVPSPYWVSYLEQIRLVDAVPIIAETENANCSRKEHLHNL